MASLIQFEPDTSVGEMLRTYVSFYEDLEPLLDYLGAEFAEITADFGAVVRRVNKRFGTSFVPYVKTEANDRAVSLGGREVQRKAFRL